jgi:hypothetical protein
VDGGRDTKKGTALAGGSGMGNVRAKDFRTSGAKRFAEVRCPVPMYIGGYREYSRRPGYYSKKTGFNMLEHSYLTKM